MNPLGKTLKAARMFSELWSRFRPATACFEAAAADVSKPRTDLFLTPFRPNGQQLFVMVSLLCLLVNQVDAQASEVHPEWKAHFKEFPVIENCVFERETPNIPEGKFKSKGETNLYQFRFQDSAFIIRQIRTLDDVNSNHVQVMSVYAGCFGTDCWAIDAGETLKLFPNGRYLTRKIPKGDGVLMFSAERMLFSTLYYGINFLNPETVEWSGDKFTALSVFGDQYFGEVVGISQGLPTVLQWYSEKTPDRIFILEYDYDDKRNLGLKYFPSEIRLFMKVEGQKLLGAVYRILILNTAATPLDESYFDYMRYFAKSSSPQTKIFVITNDQAFAVRNNGKLEKVLPSGMMPDLENSKLDKTHARTTRFIFISFLVISGVGILFTLNRKNAKNKRNDR
jgi:hypothetical protein